jgi:CDP-diacylglycerol--serine O-phosphatidyltransferase
MKSLIPSMITLMNLACGAVVILILFGAVDLAPSTSAWLSFGLMVLAMLADFADGFVARALGVASDIGKQLDSLADMVTFGLVPGLMVYQILRVQLYDPADPAATILPFIGLLIPLFSAYRLAKFNVDDRQTDHFRGFPTPPNAFLFLSIYMLFAIEELGMAASGNMPLEAINLPGPNLVGAWSILYHPVFLSVITVVMSVLLVSDIPLLSSKMKDYSFGNNWVLYVLVGISLILLAILWYKAVPIMIVLYFIASFIDRIRKKS